MSEQVLDDSGDVETPLRWGGLPVQEMLDEGYTLYKRVKGDRAYMMLRRGNSERSLGPFDQDKWDLFLQEFPTSKPDRGTKGSSFLASNIQRPKGLGSRYEPSVEVLDWFFWFRQQGFVGRLDDFLNEVVHNYFVEQGLSLAVVIRES